MFMKKQSTPSVLINKIKNLACHRVGCFLRHDPQQSSTKFLFFLSLIQKKIKQNADGSLSP